MEMEELKDELSTIIMTKTSISGRDKWDTPEVKMPNGRKGRLRKDRYSALLMANMVARNIMRAPAPPDYGLIGGTSKTLSKDKGGQMYNGPDWYTKGINQNICKGISRRDQSRCIVIRLQSDYKLITRTGQRMDKRKYSSKDDMDKDPENDHLDAMGVRGILI